MTKVFDKEITDGILIKDEATGLITITSTVLDLPSGTSLTHATSFAPDILNRSLIERGVIISDKIVKDNDALKEIKENLPIEINSLLSKEKESAAVKRGNHYYYFNCNFYGSAFGGDVQPINISFVNIWNTMKDSIDTNSLENELQVLVKELMNKAKESSDYEKIAAVSRARYELEKANGPGMLEQLKKAGKWALDVALEIGKDIAAKVISEAINK